MTNVLVVEIVTIYFAEAPEEVLVKMTNERSENRLKNQFLGVYMTSEKTRRNYKTWGILRRMWKRYEKRRRRVD